MISKICRVSNFVLRIFSQSGFSLFETLLVLGLSSIVGLLLIGLFVQNNGVSNNQHLKTSQNLSSNESFSRISNHLRNASAIVNQYPSVNPQYQTDSDTIIIQLPSIDSQGNIITNTYDYLIITKDTQNNKILREITIPHAQSSRPSTNQSLATDLQTLTFYYLDANNAPTSPTTASSVNFVINLLSAQGQDSHQSSVSAQVNLRNN